MSVAQNRKPLDVARFLDQSGSMRELAPTVIETIEAYERAMSRDMPGSKIRRVLFNDHRQELDGDFVDPHLAALQRPLRRFYKPNGSTYLYRYASHEIDSLIVRAREFGAVRRQLLIITSDGVNQVPYSLRHRYGKPRMDLIRNELMPEFWAIAIGDRYPNLDKLRDEQLNSSQLAVWYQGIGLSEEHHWKQAEGMGIPRSWFHHVPGTEEGFRYSQQSALDCSRSFAAGEGTVFVAIDPPPDSSSQDGGLTAFGIRP